MKNIVYRTPLLCWTWLGFALVSGAAQGELSWHLRATLVDDEVLNGVAWGNGLFVAVGTPGKVMTSPDGANWTPQTLGSNILWKVEYGNGRFIVSNGAWWGSGPDPQLLYLSEDGQHWTNMAWPVDEIGSIYGLAFANGSFYVISASGSMFSSSPDGKHWLRRGFPGLASVSDLVYGDGLYLAVGITHDLLSWDNEPLFLTSANGVDWTGHTRYFSQWQERDVLYATTYQNGVFVAVGTQDAILRSADATNWTAHDYLYPFELRDMASGNGVFAAVGIGGTILTSLDGANWVSNALPTIKGFPAITFGNGTFVAVGVQIYQSDPVARLALSVGSGPTLTLSGQAGAAYAIEARESLKATNEWNRLTTVTLTTNKVS
jgi:photosystem II stability/assembly factor-like uncharacterized protein